MCVWGGGGREGERNIKTSEERGEENEKVIYIYIEHS